jgi:putative transcriptional regulator
MSKKGGSNPFFESLQEGLIEGIRFLRGEVALKTTIFPEPPPEVTPDELTAMRRRADMSQAAFARLLNVSPKTVQSWEQGTRKPAQATLRLIQVLGQDPRSVFQAAGLRWPHSSNGAEENNAKRRASARAKAKTKNSS